MQSLLPWPATRCRLGGQAVRAVCAALVLGSGEASDLGASTIRGYFYVKIFIVAAVAMVTLGVLALIFAVVCAVPAVCAVPEVCTQGHPDCREQQ